MPTIRYLQKPLFLQTWIRVQLHKYFMKTRWKFMKTGDESLLEELEFIQEERRIQWPEYLGVRVCPISRTTMYAGFGHLGHIDVGDTVGGTRVVKIAGKLYRFHHVNKSKGTIYFEEV